MKRKLTSVYPLSVLLFLLAAASSPAGEVEERIKALEEVQRANAQELEQLKSEQIEVKKEATAAAAAMPNFSYRPGNGLNIEAADKSWGLRATIEADFRMYFESGRDQVGRSQGELMGRRFRPGFFYCINNCLWEIEMSLDLDGFATGNGLQGMLQRGAVNFHAENLSPWLPTVQFGMDVSTTHGGGIARRGSSSTGAQSEYDLLTRADGFNTGRAGQGIVLNWDDRSLSSIGIPGRIGRFQIAMASIGEGDDGQQSFTDRKDFNIYGNIFPFSQVKNKWLSGLMFEFGSWFCNVDARTGGTTQNGCGRFRVQDHGAGGRQTLFDTGTNTFGDGLFTAMGPGVVWNVGPYTLRTMGSFMQGEDRGLSRGKKRAHNFLIGHDLFLWSPKGFLTGSATTAGSILVGTHFERVDMSVDCNGSSGIPCASTGLGGNINQFHRNRILLREWDLWYFVAPRMSVGMAVLWYDAANLRNGRNQAAHNLGVCKTPVSAATCRSGIGGDWVDVMLGWRYTF